METVTPAHSGAPGLRIVFAAYAGEAVNVSGADRVSNWVADKNGTYRADGVGEISASGTIRSWSMER